MPRKDCVIVFCVWLAWAVPLVHTALLREREQFLIAYCVWLAWAAQLAHIALLGEHQQE